MRLRAALLLATSGLAFWSACGGDRQTRAKPADADSASTGGQQRRVGDVVFRRVRGDVERQCRRTARAVGYRVVCPQMLPDLHFPTEFSCRPAGGADDLIGTGCGAFKRWQVSSFDYAGERSEGHLVLQAAPAVVSYRRFVIDPGNRIRARLRLGPRRSVNGWRGREVRVLSAPGSALDGHTVFVWRAAGRTYGVGFHGSGAATRALNEYVVRNSRLVG